MNTETRPEAPAGPARRSRGCAAHQPGTVLAVAEAGTVLAVAGVLAVTTTVSAVGVLAPQP